MSQKKIKFMVGALLITGSIVYLISSSISKTSMYFVTVSELVERKALLAHGEPLKVKGNVVKGSIVRDPENYLDVAFSIEDKEKKGDLLKVLYKGITPDMFQDEGEVVVEGKFVEGVFHANTLLTSCPSKYEAEKEAGKLHPGNLAPYKLEKPYQEKPAFTPKTTI